MGTTDGPADGSRPGRTPGILVADDDAAVLAVLEVTLARHGFAVQTAPSGADAVEVFRDGPDRFDLVLLDVRMPGLDGPQTLAAIRQMEPRVRAVFMAAGAGKYTRSELLDRGALCVLSKPLANLDDIAALLWNLAQPASPADFRARP